MTIHGLILAGGASSRMGFPKALLRIGEESFLERLVRLLSKECSTMTVVVGAHAERIRSGVTIPETAKFVVNAEWERGQLSSLQAGLRETARPCDAVLFTPVDYPGVQQATVGAVCSAFWESSPSLVVPRYQGRRGHPVLFGGALIDDFLQLPPERQARDVVHRHSDRTRYVDVDDPWILKDTDDRREYEDLLATAPHTL